MLRRMANLVPRGLLASRTMFTFSGEGNEDKIKKKVRKFISRYTLQRLLHQQKMQKYKQQKEQGNKQEEDKSSKNESQTKDSPNAEEDSMKSKLNPDTASKIAFAIAIALIFLFEGSNKNQNQQQTNQSGRRRVVSENEMITLLATGNYHPEIIILRQMVYNDDDKKIYQTICQAKEANKANPPVTCIVLNLTLFLQRVGAINTDYKVNFHYAAEELPPRANINIGNIIVFSFLAWLIFRIRKSGVKLNSKEGMNQMLGLKKYEPIKPENISTLFKDVAGMHEAKKEVTEFVDFLKSPDKYIEMGAKIPKGALLTGPPGTGKTLLARACAGQAGVPFFYVSGSEFVQKYVGLGANRVRNLFESAAKSAPSIIFIDQIDAIGKKRNSGPFSNEQKENTLNQLLVNMDGFDSKNKIIVMAATNLKESLDPALLRPGRFDRSIEITLPNFDQRIQILKVHLQKVKFSQDFTIEELAKKVSILTPGFSGADLANICNEAAILAARHNKKAIELPQFEKATERVMAGLQRRNLFSDEQKECLAYYECGKAVASWFTEGADPIIKISITPYSKKGKGYSHQIKSEIPLRTQGQLLNKAMCYLAGRTAQNHFKGYITSNGDNDMKKAKRILTFMVAKLGMSPLIGRIGYPDIQYMRKPYSEETESKIDKQVNRLYLECQNKAEKLVVQKSKQIKKLVALILQKETLTHNTLKEVLGDRPFQDNQNYTRLLNDSEAKEQEQQVTMTPPSPR